MVWDVDGNSYIDLVYNGLSLIHGHAYPPVVDEVRQVIARGTAWPGSSVEQIEFAELLCSRFSTFDLVRFTNTGTEAGMLAVKIARRATGRPLVLKAIAGYHGSYDDLEAGLNGQGPIPGRTLLAEFGNVQSFKDALDQYGSSIAAVVLESIMFTGIVTPPPPGFLNEVEALARRAGALFVLDDCLMARLAMGGAAEKYGLTPDLTFLGKFIGGGLPVGVVGGHESLLGLLDPNHEKPMYHGGSFNGNLLGVVAGRVALEHLSAYAIARMDRQAAQLRSALEEKASDLNLPLIISGAGSVMGLYVVRELARPGGKMDQTATSALQLACLNNGIYIGPDGEVAMATVLADDQIDQIIDGIGAALQDVASGMPATEEVR